MEQPRQVCLGAGATRVETLDFDADDTAGHRDLVDRVERIAGPIDVAVLAFGVLGDQSLAEHDNAEVVRVLHTDLVAQASLLTVLAESMRPRGRGTLVAFSSVAGVRVRRANYVYGAAKAGLDGFASGLSDALRPSGVRLVLVRPGFVVGRMTQGLKPAPLSSTPAQVGAAVAAAVARGRSSEVWVPRPLQALFAVAPLVPRAVWGRLSR